MRIFITGATGYIGSHVAKAFRNAGHRVYGLTRSANKAKLLMADEIIPVIGSMQEPDSFLHIAKDSDVLVHAAVDYENDSAELDLRTVENLISSSSANKRPKKMIYTSGTWVHGNTGSRCVTENDAHKPISIVAWRPDVENLVLQKSSINGIVIRPGVVYGKQGGMTASWFTAAHDDKPLTVVGNGENHWAMVHVNDLAQAYVQTAESNMRNEVFDITDGSCKTVREMASSVIEASGGKSSLEFLKLEEARTSMGDFAEALAIDQTVSSQKAHELLNWTTKHAGFMTDVDLYYKAWEAQNYKNESKILEVVK